LCVHDSGPMIQGPDHRALRNEAIHVDALLLPDAMHPVHRLQVGRWVPVRVVENDRVRGDKGDTETPSAGGYEVTEVIAAIVRF
jgi:hypothetical protein